MLKKEIRLIKNIPENWNAYVLSELGEFKNGINKDKSSFGFGVPFVNLMDVFGKSSIKNSSFSLVDATEKEQEIYNLQAGDILFVRSSVKPEGVGQTCVVVESLASTVYSGFLIRFRPDSKLINWQYATHCFDGSRFRQRLLVHSTVAANTNINQESLKQLAIQLPPLPEQKAIAALLSTWDEAIEKTERLIQAKEKRFKWLLRELISEPRNTQKNTEWKKVKLGDLFGKAIKVEKGKALTKESNTEGNIPVVAGGQTYAYHTNHPTHEIPTVTVSASGAYAGFIWYHDYPIWASDCNVLHATEGVTKFLYFTLKAIQHRVYALQSGGAQPHVYSKDMKNLHILWPSIEEQHETSETLSSAQQEIDLLKQLADKYKTQKRGLMQKMLTGEWRVRGFATNDEG
jgi:type I restriction enzyme S subunit